MFEKTKINEKGAGDGPFFRKLIFKLFCLSVENRKPTHFVDMQGRQVDHDAMKMIEDLSEKKIPSKLEGSNCKRYEVEWVGMAGYRFN